MPMNTNTAQLNLEHLGYAIEKSLVQSLLGHVTDIDQLDMIERNSDKLAEATLLSVGADEATKAALQMQIAEATAVLASLASAQMEDTAGAIRTTIATAVSGAIQLSEKFLRAAIIGAAVA